MRYLIVLLILAGCQSQPNKKDLFLQNFSLEEQEEIDQELFEE
jgi:hypothetical protein